MIGGIFEALFPQKCALFLMAPCPLNLKECKISFSQVKLASKVEFNFGWHTWKLQHQNCSTQDSFQEEYNPTVFDNYSKKLVVDGDGDVTIVCHILSQNGYGSRF